MPTKRQVLDLLHRNELLAVADRFELSVQDRRIKEQLVDAAASSRMVALPEVLGDYSRDRLKELCVALDLEDSGREKPVLVERLVGAKAAPPAQPAAGNGKTKATNGTAAQIALAPGVKLTREQLEGYLWSAADILRGSIDCQAARCD